MKASFYSHRTSPNPNERVNSAKPQSSKPMLQTALKCAALVLLAMILWPQISDGIERYQKAQQKLQLSLFCSQELDELMTTHTRLSNSVWELEQKRFAPNHLSLDETVRLNNFLCFKEGDEMRSNSNAPDNAKKSQDPCGDLHEFYKKENEILTRQKDKFRSCYKEMWSSKT